MNSLVPNTWQHILITYDGGTTGPQQNELSDYYDRFNIYIDGALQTLTKSHTNNGFVGSINDDYFRLGRSAGTAYMRGSRVDELALWDSDQSANISDIYNSGSTQDLSLLTPAPNHWWRMGDGDTYPTLQDNVGSVDITMNNMTVEDIVTDAP